MSDAARPAFAEDGTVAVPAFALPASAFSSPEAQAAQAMRAKMPINLPGPALDIATVRAGMEAMLAPKVEGVLAAFPVEVIDDTIAGVPVKVFTPKDRPFDPDRVLINLHGGAFTMGWPSCAFIESPPIAVLGGYKVISVNYRMAPEHRHPAGAEDVAAVYAALLDTYPAERIAIYGGSAGGALTGQMGAWLPAHGLPQPAALGIFGAGAARFNAGDSAYIAGYIDGSFPPPPKPGEPEADMTNGYFAGWDMTDPSISPALHPDVMAQFPPTLIITGTRAMDMSPAIVTNSALLKAGVRSTLIVGEAMGHCYHYQFQLPEAQDANQAIIDFLRENLR
ncbi:alpha/beta hydrolase [Novosphingobium sp. JCM 18896]|uniref:alpha/beta hydrolase n=1 Tax=Novosphingobium sp. JCM 18896 TaxID=2989731 RepID=UPI002221EE2D|nr:alpha/beta hydrolase [Novosphingobium sp. JCM 18896]MCW1430143.1 alpha/beta hydrolase [Novosphingobium sp. JCM 18896]